MYDIMKTKKFVSCLKNLWKFALQKKKSRLFPVESNLRAEAMKNFDQIFACVVLIPGIDE